MKTKRKNEVISTLIEYIWNTTPKGSRIQTLLELGLTMGEIAEFNPVEV